MQLWTLKRKLVACGSGSTAQCNLSSNVENMESGETSGNSNFFRNFKCTKPTQKRTYVIGGIVLLFVVLGIFLIVHLSTGSDTCPDGIHCNWKSMPSSEYLTDERCDQLCTTKACLKAADFALNLINSTQDPCQDFYEFACGAINSHVIIAEAYGVKMVQSTETDMEREFLKKIEDAIITDPITGKKGSALEFVTEFYEDCNSPDIELEKTLNYTLESYAKGIPMYWPLLSSQERTDDVSEKLARYSVVESNPFFGVEYDIEEKESDKLKWIVQIFPPDEEMLHNVYNGIPDSPLQTNIMERYEYVLKTILELLRVKESNIYQIVEEIKIIDRRLIRIIQDYEKQTSSYTSEQVRQYTCKEMERRYPQLKWCTFMKNYLLANDKPESTRMFMRIGRQGENYFHALNDLLGGLSFSNMANYLNMRYVMNILPALPERFRTLYYSDPEIFPKTAILKSAKTKWEQCIALTIQLLWVPFYKHYMSFNFDQEKRERVEEMIGVMKKTMLEAVEGYKWLSDEHRTLITSRLKSTSTILDFSDVLPDMEKLDENFDRSASKEKDNFFVSYIDGIEGTKIIGLKMEHFGPFRMGQVTGGNKFLLGLGLFQFPIIDDERPKYLDYSTLGAIILGAMTPSLDDFFFRNNESTIGKEDSYAMLQKRKCIHDQFAEYKIDVVNIKVDPDMTEESNFETTFGLQGAIQAYKKYLDEHGDEKGLPGLPFSNEQLFFISYAQRFCEVRSSKGYREYTKMGQSPSRHRVNGPLSNTADFSEAFRCPLGSPMNPKVKCCLVKDDSKGGAGHRCI